MISATTLCKELLNVNGLVVDDADFFTIKYGELCILIKVHLRKGLQWKCPVCGKRYTRIYDAPYEHKRWRALDFGGILVYIEAYLPRICCKEHGVKTADVPWAFPNSNFTKDVTIQIPLRESERNIRQSDDFIFLMFANLRVLL